MTTPTITAADIERVLELSEKATQGDWYNTSNHSTIPEAQNTIMSDDVVIAWACTVMPKFLDSLSARAWRKANSIQLRDNAAFIASAPLMARIIREQQRVIEAMAVHANDLLDFAWHNGDCATSQIEDCDCGYRETADRLQSALSLAAPLRGRK